MTEISFFLQIFQNTFAMLTVLHYYYLLKGTYVFTGENFSEVQILRPPKPGSLLVIVLSCPQIGSLSSSTANQRAAQNNYRALGCQDLYNLPT